MATPASVPQGLRLKCHIGGHFEETPHGSRRYVGGEIRVITLPQDISYSELMFKLCEDYGGVSLKYELGDGDLVTVRSQEDMLELAREYRYLLLKSQKRFLEVYLFEALEDETYGMLDLRDSAPMHSPSMNSNRLCHTGEEDFPPEYLLDELHPNRLTLDYGDLLEMEQERSYASGSPHSPKPHTLSDAELSATPDTGEIFVYRPPRKFGRDSVDCDSKCSISTCVHDYAMKQGEDLSSRVSTCSATLLGLQAVAEGVAEGVLGSSEVVSVPAHQTPVLAPLAVPLPAIPSAPLRGAARPEQQELNADFEIPYTELDLGAPLGRGGFGEVFKAFWRGTEVAVKKFYQCFAPPIQRDDFRHEVTMLSNLRHPNVVLFMGYSPPPSFSIVTELCWGSVHTLLRTPSVKLTYSQILKLATDIARGMTYLHERKPPIVHLDLKSQNCLVDSNMNAKITDFGLSRYKLHSYISGRHGMRGTFGWMAPEVIGKSRFTEKADVWSYGMVLWEMITQKEPFENKDTPQIIYEVMLAKSIPDIPSFTPFEYSQLVSDCLKFEPATRPSFSDIVRRLRDITESLPSEVGARIFPSPPQSV
mmetsp:Transcript_14616/g.24936  ORF Transcript_14616/g.24936 Transcript_14616/m.24936 type:complete len:590 (-) Transcript_14616:914-2683(-)|eukprot:CAMPEP_0196660474 /NCGR_PEP_ID=MMETSP1086-20130531/39930_1 /TAXON_ID=77921 /ORGANISM="Cyanoptyche  gloeocystis , Strain SAG4.97" /LENGTH=589 /DNA_ID=CAMNT_0041994903 /DNA_START=217 /DNA_END=1986 /DNA_ORIENTATION=+